MKHLRPSFPRAAVLRMLFMLLALLTATAGSAQVSDPTRGLHVYGGNGGSSSTIKRNAKKKNPQSSGQTTRRRPSGRSGSRSQTTTAIDYDTYSPALERRAQNGDLRAINTVAFAYLNGDGVEEDEEKALYYFDKGADRGDADMMVVSGVLHKRNDEYATAFSRFTQAHYAGSSWGTYELAKCYINGEGTAENTTYGLTLLEKAADAGLADAQEDLGMCYMAGSDKLGIKQTTYKGMDLLLKAAAQDDDDALLDLGVIYLQGRYGYDVDAAKAYTYLKKAVDLNNADAMDYLGDMYRYGLYVAQDKSQAFDWYLKAADAGSTFGHADVGSAYRRGDLVAQDYGEAVKHLTLAANKGNNNAQFNLGLCYEYGEGVNEDMTIAMNLYCKAASGGLNAAMSRYGAYISSFYNKGRTSYDWVAYELFRWAADGGESWGMFYLGRCLYEGVGHKRDRAAGIYWLHRAEKEEDQLAIDYISKNGVPANTLTDEQGQAVIQETTGNESNAAQRIIKWAEDNDAVTTNDPSYQSTASARITSVYRSDYLTLVVFCVTCKSTSDGGYAINRNTHIVAGGKEYKLIDMGGIKFSPDWTRFDYVGEERYFYLVFSPLPHDTRAFDLIESKGADQWQFYDISCTAKQ